jgi:hypothetical protein
MRSDPGNGSVSAETRRDMSMNFIRSPPSESATVPSPIMTTHFPEFVFVFNFLLKAGAVVAYAVVETVVDISLRRIVLVVGRWKCCRGFLQHPIQVP